MEASHEIGAKNGDGAREGQTTHELDSMLGNVPSQSVPSAALGVPLGIPKQPEKSPCSLIADKRCLLSGDLARGVVRFVYLVLPNLEHFNMRGELVHGLPVPWAQVGFAMLYGLAYTALVLLAATAVFERRDFV